MTDEPNGLDQLVRIDGSARYDATAGIRLPDVAELAEVEALIPYANNSRQHTEDDVAELAGMFVEYGFTVPIVVKGTRVAAGHLRLRAARKAGMRVVPIIRRDDLTEEQFRAYVIADNRIAEKATWDKKMLVAEFASLQKANFALPKTGFSLKEADDVRKAANKEEKRSERQAGENDVHEVPANAITRNGDLWELGQHRLWCGDSLLNVQNLKDVFGFNEVHLVATDPPYAIYGSATGISSSISDDKMVRPFFEKVLELAQRLLPWFGHCYLCCDWRSSPSICYAAKNVPTLERKNELIWDKGDYGMGNNYFNCYEKVEFFAKLPPEKTMTGSRDTGQRPIFKPNIMRFPRPAGTDREHNAAKPVALFRELIENSTGPGDRVLEPFAGSGTTLIAADQTERVCYAVEIEPHWCDVIIWRWMRLNGGTARLASTGQSFEEVAHERGEGGTFVGKLKQSNDKAAAEATKKKRGSKKSTAATEPGDGEPVH